MVASIELYELQSVKGLTGNTSYDFEKEYRNFLCIEYLQLSKSYYRMCNKR